MAKKLNRDLLSLPLLHPTPKLKDSRTASWPLVINRSEPSNPDKSEVVSPPLSSSTSCTSSLHDCTSPIPELSEEEVYPSQLQQNNSEKLPPIIQSPPRCVKSVQTPDSFPLRDSSKTLPSVQKEGKKKRILSPTSRYVALDKAQGSTLSFIEGLPNILHPTRRLSRVEEQSIVEDPLFTTTHKPTSATGNRKPLSLRKRTPSAPISTPVLQQPQQPFRRLKSSESRSNSPLSAGSSEPQEVSL